MSVPGSLPPALRAVVALAPHIPPRASHLSGACFAFWLRLRLPTSAFGADGPAYRRRPTQAAEASLGPQPAVRLPPVPSRTCRQGIFLTAFGVLSFGLPKSPWFHKPKVLCRDPNEDR